MGILKEEFGYSNVSKVHYCVPPKSLEVGLRLLVDDAAAGRMLYEAVGSQVQIYVEHGHEEEEDEFNDDQLINDEICHEVSEEEEEVSEGYLIDELDMLEEDEQVAEEIDMHVLSDTQVHSELEVHSDADPTNPSVPEMVLTEEYQEDSEESDEDFVPDCEDESVTDSDVASLDHMDAFDDPILTQVRKEK
ncbi:hypothetical protein FRX31_021057, partial [Thalictrum thalictroides]